MLGMPELVELYKKYRPTKFSEVVGQSEALSTLMEMGKRGETPHFILFTGPSGCIRGDSSIYDPVDGSTKTVRQRWEDQSPFHVLSLSAAGVAVIGLALPPVKYPPATMFRVETDQSVFYATGEHRLCLSGGSSEFLSLTECVSGRFGEVRLLSTEAHGRKVRQQDALHYLKKERDFRGDYPVCSYYDDGRLLSFQEAFQSVVPLHGGVQVHSCYLHVSQYSRPLLQSAPLSNSHSLRRNSLSGEMGSLFFSKNVLRSFQSSYFGPQFQTSTSLIDRVERSLDLVQELSLASRQCSYSAFSDKHLLACDPPIVGASRFGYTSIKKVDMVGQDEYFDFHVLAHNNYWMDGLFHHNCGKTTLARILKDKLGCTDFTEVNAASERGIDMVRDLDRVSRYGSLDDGPRVWLIDECFPGFSIVNTDRGFCRIDQVRVGDLVENAKGRCRVRRVFKNRVSVDQVVRIVFSDGHVLYTTKEHNFLTGEGWVPAKRLADGYCIFRRGCYPMNKGDNHADLCLLQDGLCAEKQEQNRMLFQKLRSAVEEPEEGVRADCLVDLQRMRGEILCYEEQRWAGSYILREGVFGIEQVEKTGISKGTLFRADDPEEGGVFSKLFNDPRWGCLSGAGVKKNDRAKSSLFCCCGREGAENKGEEGCITYMARRTGWQWKADEITSSTLARVAGGDEIRLGFRGSSSDKSGSFERGLSKLLQDRFGVRGVEVRGRGRWENAQIEKGYLERCKKEPEVARVGVVCVESYKSGCNDESFRCVISDSDRDRGFVEFFDLEIEDHPSYMVEGCLVHNCHAITSDAQSAFLKLLEDTPSHAYFFAATTDPQKLKKTILTRATIINCKPVSESDLQGLVRRVIALEDKLLDDDVITRIAEGSDGSARKALVILHQVINLKDHDQQIKAIESVDSKIPAFEICQALIAGEKWTTISKILKDIESEDAEGIRRMILVYARKVLLSKGNDRAAMIIQEFRDHFFDCGAAGLAVCCYNVARSK